MHNDIFSIGNFTIHGYGLMIAIGFLVAVAVGEQRAKKKGMDGDAIVTLGMLVIVLGFAGAKLLHVLTNMRAFLNDPLSVLGSNGFVVYGGLIVGVLVGYIYCKKKKLVFLKYFDIIMPSVALAQAFGRIGCFLAGCCYGRETHSFLGVKFPEGSMAPSGVSLIPTQLISSLGDFLIAFLLIWYSKHAKRDGNTGFMYFVLYGIGRFTIECFRADERGNVGPLSTSQFISIFMVVAALILLIFRNQKVENSENE